MDDFFYLDEKNYENVVYSHKSVKPTFVTDEFIIWNFPDGNYMLDSLYIVIKLDGNTIAQHNLTLEDFISRVDPFYTHELDHGCNTNLDFYKNISSTDKNVPTNSYSTKPIPADFITAYTDMCKLNKNKLYFCIPLLRMVSIYTRTTESIPEFIQRPHIKLIRQQNYNVDAVSIFQEITNVNLDNMPTEIMDYITKYSESKIQFELFYRETKFYSSVGKQVPPELTETYVLDKCSIKFDNVKTNTINISDPTYHYNYKNMLIITDLNSGKDADSDQPNNYIDEIILQTKFSSRLDVKNVQFEELFKDGAFKMSKEYAEIFNINYQIGFKYYLVDISKFIKTYVQFLIQNKSLFYNVFGSKTEFGSQWYKCRVPKSCDYNQRAVDELFKERLDLRQKLIDELMCQPKTPEDNEKLIAEMGLVLALTLNLKNADTGSAQIYLF
jgi:hypothetical protein